MPLVVQASDEPDSVPVAVPAISSVPRHFALNVPDPLLPEMFVTVQVKFVQALGAFDVDDDVHAPCSV